MGRSAMDQFGDNVGFGPPMLAFLAFLKIPVVACRDRFLLASPESSVVTRRAICYSDWGSHVGAPQSSKSTAQLWLLSSVCHPSDARLVEGEVAFPPCKEKLFQLLLPADQPQTSFLS